MNLNLRRDPTIQAYVALGRFASPAGALYLLAPCWWGLLLADAPDGARTLALAALFALGAFVMRACGCAWNDLVDRDFDALNERTKMRPLACRALTPRQATLFISATALCGALVLIALAELSEGTLMLYLVLASVPLAILYPLAKRVTHYPQFVLGVVFSWGVLCGYSALENRLDPAVLWMAAAGVAWTIVYDTVYGFQDIEDDRKSGVKSFAIVIAERAAKPLLAGIYAGFLVLTACAVSAAGLSLARGVVVLVLVALAFLYDVLRLDLSNPASCLKFFKREVWRGGLGASLVLLLASL